MTTNVRKRNRRTQSQPGIWDHISQGVSSLLDSGTLLSPNHDIYVAQRELDEYKRNNPTHSVANDPDGVIRGLLERQAGGVSLDPENKGVVGLMGSVAKKTIRPSVGVNINDKKFPFTEKIISGEKTIETRNTNSLKGQVGEDIGIIRTGKGKPQVIGYAKVGEPVIYNNKKEFRKDQGKHLVEEGSEFDIKEGGVKYGYPLTNVEKIDPFPVTSKGIVTRKIGKGLLETPKGGVTADEVLALSRKKQIPFGKWSEQDTTPNLLNLSGSKPSIPDYPSPPRFFPTDRADIDRVRELVNNPKVSRRARKYAKEGASALPDSWYSTSPLYKIYVEELGEKGAKKKFIQDMEIFAATSPVSKVPNNIKIGSLYQYYAAMGKEIPENVRKAADGFLPDQQFPPPGYGAKTQGNHLLNSRRVLSGEGMSARKNPKPVSFAANLIGNEKVLTADTHYFRALGMFAEDPRFLLTKAEVPVMKNGKIVQVENKQGKLVIKTKEINPRKMVENGEMTMKEALKKPVFWDGAPKETEYALLEQYGQKIAKSLGMTPARFQEALWLGSGKLTGLQSPPEPFIRTLEKRIKYTAEQLGADPETVMRQYVRGEIPLAEVGEDQQSRYGGLLA